MDKINAGISSISNVEPKRIDAELKSRGLPKGYGETKIVLMPRDPFWAFVYWELSPETRDELRGKYALRVYDLTGIDFNGGNAHKYFDIEINAEADSWYINVPEINRDWCVDIGVRMSDGRFVTAARSNIVCMPRYGLSPVIDEQWRVIKNDFHAIVKLSDVEHVGKSSFDIINLMKGRWDEFKSISSFDESAKMSVQSKSSIQK